MIKPFVILGAANAAICVVAGAFGAHVLSGELSNRQQDVYATAVQYHFWHALGLTLVGLCDRSRMTGGWVAIAGWSMLAGVVLFSGSLYALALGASTRVGFLTPIGGLAFIVGWVAFALALMRSR